MNVSIDCSNCGRTLKAPERHIGKRAKCPACGEAVLIETTEARAGSGNGKESPAQQQSGPDNGERTKSTTIQNIMAARLGTPAIIVIVVCSLLAGYFAGREHIKYERRSAFAEAGQAFQQGLQKAFDWDDEQTSKVVESGTIDDPEPPPLEFGKAYNAGEFSLALVGARIDHVELESSITGEKGTTDEKYLLCTFRAINTHERKLLAFREYFGGSYFVLHDDVDNPIRGVDFLTDNPVDALTGSDEIKPGEEMFHTEVFKIPLPKTQHLVLAVDLGAFSGEGAVRFMIPTDRINGLPGS